MPLLYPNQPISNDTVDGVNITLTKPLVSVMRNGRWLRVKIGGTSDGLTSPKFLKLYLEDSNSFQPSVWHDGAWRNQLEESFDLGLTWLPVTLTFDEANTYFYELLLDNQVHPDVAQMMYDAVCTVGKRYFAEDRNK